MRLARSGIARRSATILLLSFLCCGPVLAEPPDEELTGHEIYARVLENRFESFEQKLRMESGSGQGASQATRVTLWYQSGKNEYGGPRNGNVLSKALVRYTDPFDLRHTGYLVVNRQDAPDDQFVYFASRRRVKRVNLRGEAVFGTDFSYEDVLPRELEDATYTRLRDAEIEGRAAWVVDAVPEAVIDSEYSRIRVTVEKARAVPLQARYWDRRGLEVKRLEVAAGSIERVDEIWVARQATMHHVQRESYTKVDVEEIANRPGLPASTFELRRLEGR